MDLISVSTFVNISHLLLKASFPAGEEPSETEREEEKRDDYHANYWNEAAKDHENLIVSLKYRK